MGENRIELASKEYLKEVIERSNADEKYRELVKGENHLNRVPR